MPHQLHVDTSVLRAARVTAGELSSALRPEALDPGDLAVLTNVPGGRALIAEHDRLLTAVSRSADELAELDTALGIATAAAEGAEWSAVRSLTGGVR